MMQSQPFKGLTFLFTGRLSTYTRVEAESFVKQNGGKVKTSVTSEVSHIVVGTDADDKLQKAIDLGTVTVLSEDEFIRLLNQDSQVANDDVDEDLQRVIDELGDLDEESSDEDQSEDESTDEFSGNDLTSFFINRFGSDEMKNDYQKQQQNESSIEEQIESMLDELEPAEGGSAGDDNGEANGGKNRSDLDESIDTFVDYANSIEEPSGLLLLTAFTLIDITMRDSSLDNSEFFGKFSRFVGWVHTQAYQWGIADEQGFLPQDVVQEYLAQSKALSVRYSKAVDDDFVSYRTFLKNIGAAGIGASLSPEERGDLSTYLLMFKHAVSLLFEDSYASISRDVDATIEQIDCSDLVGDLSGVAEQGGNAFVESYSE